MSATALSARSSKVRTLCSRAREQQALDAKSAEAVEAAGAAAELESEAQQTGTRLAAQQSMLKQARGDRGLSSPPRRALRHSLCFGPQRCGRELPPRGGVACAPQVGREAIDMREAMRSLRDSAAGVALRARNQAVQAAEERERLQRQHEALARELADERAAVRGTLAPPCGGTLLLRSRQSHRRAA